MESSDSFPETHNLPPALKTDYEIGEPNKPIPLHEGDLEIEHQGNLTQGSGTVYLKWFPFPQIQFESSGHQLLGSNVEKAYLKVPETDGVEALIVVKHGFNQATGETKEVLGNVRKPIVKGSGQELTYIKFHLTNFENFNGSSRAVIEDESGARIGDRGIFEAEGWKVTIDPYKTSEQINSKTSSINILKSQGGYAVTHVGKLERLDGETFTANEPSTRSFLEALSYFLSFVRGLRIEPLLLIGYDANSDQRIWEEWALSNSDPWRKDLVTWAWGLRAEDIASAFRGFLSWWQSWGESAKIVVHWYIASNAQAGAIEGSIVFEQAAFELLSRIFIVEKKSILSPEGFDKLPAADRLKLLLYQCRIPLEVPKTLTNLSSFSKEENYNDGVQILTEIRNFIAHSGNPKKRERFFKKPELVRVEAYTLGLWYLELILLSIFDYKGSYYNRLSQGNIGYREPVPWLS